MPADLATRAKVRTWMSAAEGTFFLHGLAIFYGSASVPNAAERLQNAISGAVHRDFDWLESELKQGGGKFLVGNSVTAADTMMEFPISFILKNELGTKGKKWPAVEAWLKNVQSTKGYKKAVAKTGYKL
jgi:glutathione S-transferase